MNSKHIFKLPTLYIYIYIAKNVSFLKTNVKKQLHRSLLKDSFETPCKNNEKMNIQTFFPCFLVSSTRYKNFN